MVSLKSVEQQLKQIRFNYTAWNRAEALELQNILMPDEEIYECVNGTYEGGIALLCATNVRVLLVDKKPFKFLNVEDLRFDMINEIDYSHRLIGARISIATGTKNLTFMSYNQQRLRKLISHVQHCMAEVKQELSKTATSQKDHLEQINQQLQAYLLAQQLQQEDLRRQLEAAKRANGDPSLVQLPEPIKPSPELSDYLFAHTLLKRYESDKGGESQTTEPAAGSFQAVLPDEAVAAEKQQQGSGDTPQLADLYAAGMQEIFGKSMSRSAPEAASSSQIASPPTNNPLEINPLRIAYSKLPMVLRNRAFAQRSRVQQRVSDAPQTASGA